MWNFFGWLDLLIVVGYGCRPLPRLNSIPEEQLFLHFIKLAFIPFNTNQQVDWRASHNQLNYLFFQQREVNWLIAAGVEWMVMLGWKPITNHPAIKRKVYFSFMEGAANHQSINSAQSINPNKNKKLFLFDWFIGFVDFDWFIEKIKKNYNSKL